MKNFLFGLIIISFFVTSFFVIEKKHTQNVSSLEKTEEVRAIFFSYLELNKYIKNKTEEESKQNIKEVISNMKNNNFNTLILHVRPFSDAIYYSSIFPISDTVKVNGGVPSYDILKYFIQEAHKNDVQIHAWINPYRISSDEDIKLIKKDNPAYSMLETKDVKVVEGKGIFYNPASEKVNNLILSGIEELLINYEIDGIHFDDYFYPSTDIDIENYESYIKNGGNLSIDDYRYQNILTLIKSVYLTVKRINKEVMFGISPEGNISNNYNKQFLDIKTILSTEGYVDYIMPQIYFGFNNEVKPFLDTLCEWNSLIKDDNITLLPALAFYKVGQYDKYAKSGSNEWMENNNVIYNQVIESRKLNNYHGFSLFRYDYVFSKKTHNTIELKTLNKALN